MQEINMEGRRRNRQNISNNTLDFFHVRDGSDITWLHAVNDVKKLQEGLSGKAMMLEADVLLRHNHADGMPIMAHPPAVDSDLSLLEFLNQTIASIKGIKLDFKSLAAVEPSLRILQEQVSRQGSHNPIWLNANIFSGPCNDGSCNPLDPQVFLTLCAEYFPTATLSLGWTTSEYLSTDNDYYEWSFVQPVEHLLSDITQPVTFPVRANLVRKSWKQILWLLSLSQNYSLTIWSAVHDTPNMKDLVALRNAVLDKSRIFYDLPPNQRLAFTLNL